MPEDPEWTTASDVIGRGPRRPGSAVEGGAPRSLPTRDEVKQRLLERLRQERGEDWRVYN